MARQRGKGAALHRAPRHNPLFLHHQETKASSLANPELGAKQICPSCSTKFYDLGRRPAHCPKCQTEFDPEEALRSRRVRARAPLPEDDTEEEKPKVAEDVEDGFEAEPDDEDLEAADDDEVPFIEDEDEDDPFPEDDIEGLGPEGADDR